MRALIEHADDIKPKGKGEDHIVDGKLFSIRVNSDEKGTYIRVFDGDTIVDLKRYPFFIHSLDAAMRIARRRLIKYICETHGGTPSDIAYAKNRVQQIELEIFPQFYLKEDDE